MPCALHSFGVSRIESNTIAVFAKNHSSKRHLSSSECVVATSNFNFAVVNLSLFSKTQNECPLYTQQDKKGTQAEKNI